LGVGINTTDITKILSAEQYDSFIDSSQPKMFIKNGAWFDMKERAKPVRYEKWRELELEEKRKLQIESPNRIANQKEVSEWLKKYKPEFIKELGKLKNKFKV
jgi:hypothetical protein